MQIRLLTLDEVLEIHETLIMDQDEGEKQEGVLSMNLLQICINSPSRNFFGFEPFDDLFKKAGILMFEIVHLHPFVDGNKRTAYTSGKVFLILNGYLLKAPIQEVLKMMIGVTKGADSYEDLVEFVRIYSHKIQNDEEDSIRIEIGSFDPFKPDHMRQHVNRFEEFEISIIV